MERVYAIWEHELQLIRNSADVQRFATFFSFSHHCIETDIKTNEQSLTAYTAENDKELTDSYERLRGLQNQNFKSNTTKQLAVEQERCRFNFIRKRGYNLAKAELKLLTTEDRFREKTDEIIDRFENLFTDLPEQQQNEDQQQGLNPRKIRSFKLFTADESHVGDQCSICMEDIDVGRRMRRLTCDGQHYFCKKCIEGWFAEHNTCPLCRHKFD